MAENFPITFIGTGADHPQQDQNEPAVFTPNLQNFGEARAYCYTELWLDFDSDWYKEGTLPPCATFRLYNYLSREYSELDYGLSWLFGDTEEVSIDETHNDSGTQSSTLHLERSSLTEDSWVNDKLGLRLSATEFKDYVMLADPLAGLAAAPWFHPLIVSPVSIPLHFPISVSQIIRQLPLFDAETGHNLQKVAVDFINATFAAENPADMHILQRIGSFLALGLGDMHRDIARTFVYMIRRVRGYKNGQTFAIGDMLQFHAYLYLWKGRFGSWLKLLPQDLIGRTLGVPVNAESLLHVLWHIRVNVGEGIDFTLTMTYCTTLFYSGNPSFPKVKEFVASLPTIGVDGLADDDRECAICRGPYGELGSMLNGDPEGAVKLPCSHVFGKLCLTILLGPKPEGWGQRLCPLCRQEVPLHPKMVPSGFRQ